MPSPPFVHQMSDVCRSSSLSVLHLHHSCFEWSIEIRLCNSLSSVEMASIMRPAVLQKSGLSATRTTGAFSANPSIAQALRPIASRATRATIGHRSILPRRPLTAPFHHTSRHSILPPGPQIISGTANDPAPVPKPSPTHGSYHWTFERALSLGLVPLTVAPFAYGSLNPALDAVLVAAILLHSHVGFS